jgi:hypothetical protein
MPTVDQVVSCSNPLLLGCSSRMVIILRPSDLHTDIICPRWNDHIADDVSDGPAHLQSPITITPHTSACTTPTYVRAFFFPYTEIKYTYYPYSAILSPTPIPLIPPAPIALTDSRIRLNHRDILRFHSLLRITLQASH